MKELLHLSRKMPPHSYQSSQYVVPRGGIFLGKWRSTFAESSDSKMNVQSAYALNTLYMKPIHIVQFYEGLRSDSRWPGASFRLPNTQSYLFPWLIRRAENLAERELRDSLLNIGNSILLFGKLLSSCKEIAFGIHINETDLKDYLPPEKQNVMFKNLLFAFAIIIVYSKILKYDKR
jgi:hypothetical protein